MGLFDLLSYTKSQTRISTAFDRWLDFIAFDFFALRLARRPAESDDSFRSRIQVELLRDRCTRASVYTLLTDLTGKPPIIFEPTNPEDTGCYNSASYVTSGQIAYGISGGWGSLNLPFQVFVKVFQPAAPGVAMINGWNGSLGGFGAGCGSYIDIGMNASQASDLEIMTSLCRIAPIGTVIWISIEP